MKAYMIQVKVDGAWFNAYLCATKLEAQRKAQHWHGLWMGHQTVN